MATLLLRTLVLRVVDAVNFGLPITVIISDNDTTAMTGGQDSSGSGSLYDICVGVGVSKDHIKTIVPLKRNLEENIHVLKEEMDYNGVSVIWQHASVCKH